MSVRGRAPLLSCAWLLACTHAPIGEKSGAGASGFGRTAEGMHATLPQHVTPAPAPPASHAGTDPDSPALAAHDAGSGSNSSGESTPANTPSMTHGETGMPEAAPPSLRAAQPGSAPLFDPGAVYILGMSSEGVDVDPQAIAPVVDSSDSVFAVGWFSRDWIRQDGHLLYQDNNYGDPLREFLRDAAPGTGDRHAGETEFSSSLPCNPSEAAQSTQRRYLVAWDGSLYHSCGNSDVVAPPSDANVMAWYDAAGHLVYSGDIWPARVGAQGRALGQRGDALIVFDFASGAELGSSDITGQAAIAVRMHESGFWVALRDTQSAARTWLEIDPSGAVTARGAYSAMPEGVAYAGPSNPWTDGGAAAIDGQGRLYEFASELGASDGGSDLVVVRRVRGEGSSDVPYHSGRYDPKAPHDIFVMEPLFITGG